MIEQVLCGRNHSLIQVKNEKGEKRLLTFGLENGMGVDGVTSTHVPQQINFLKIRNLTTDLSLLYCRYNSNILVDRRNRVFIWGEDISNLKLRKPKLLYIFPKKV